MADMTITRRRNKTPKQGGKVQLSGNRKSLSGRSQINVQNFASNPKRNVILGSFFRPRIARMKHGIFLLAGVRHFSLMACDCGLAHSRCYALQNTLSRQSINQSAPPLKKNEVRFCHSDCSTETNICILLCCRFFDELPGNLKR